MVGKLETEGFDPKLAKRIAEIRDVATRDKAIARAGRIGDAVTISPSYPDRESAPRQTAKRQPKAKAKAKARVKAKAKAKAKRKGAAHG